MRITKPRMPGVEWLLLAVALVWVGSSIAKDWREDDPVAVPESDRVVGVTLLCGTERRDFDCTADNNEGDWQVTGNRRYELVIRTPQGTAYTVEYPAVQRIAVGDPWPESSLDEPYSWRYMTVEEWRE